jgi:hypothetical protein
MSAAIELNLYTKRTTAMLSGSRTFRPDNDRVSSITLIEPGFLTMDGIQGDRQ